MESIRRQANNELCLAKETLMNWQCFEIGRTSVLKAEWEVSQQEGGEEFKCYMIWQMMVALLHSNGQLRTERDGDTEKGCQKLAVQQKTADDDDVLTAIFHVDPS